MTNDESNSNDELLNDETEMASKEESLPLGYVARAILGIMSSNEALFQISVTGQEHCDGEDDNH